LGPEAVLVKHQDRDIKPGPGETLVITLTLVP